MRVTPVVTKYRFRDKQWKFSGLCREIRSATSDRQRMLRQSLPLHREVDRKAFCGQMLRSNRRQSQKPPVFFFVFMPIPRSKHPHQLGSSQYLDCPRRSHQRMESIHGVGACYRGLFIRSTCYRGKNDGGRCTNCV